MVSQLTHGVTSTPPLLAGGQPHAVGSTQVCSRLWLFPGHRKWHTVSVSGIFNFVKSGLHTSP